MEVSGRSPFGGHSDRGERLIGSAIDASMSILAGIDREIISFAMGSPAPDAIPSDLIKRQAAEILGSRGAAASLDYSPTEGMPGLRRELLARLRQQGMDVAPENLLVTSGGMQGLDLVGKLFLDPGDVAFAELPSYPNGLATLANYQATVVQVPLDSEGMDLAAARTLIDAGKTPRLIYVIPTHQNPSGVCYSLNRRRALLEFASELGALVIEDDPYSELHYEGPRVPSLLELEGGRGGVVQVRTFSKILAPGLRLGWLIAPQDSVRKMIDARQSMDTCSNSLAQAVVAGIMQGGHLDEHISRLRRLYPARRDAMVTALERHLSGIEGVTWSKPSGGMFLWLALPNHLDASDVQALALEEGVAVVPGAAFGPKLTNAVRLCFSAVEFDAIETGVQRLARAMTRLDH